MQEGVVTRDQFVVSGCDTSELLEPIEEAFDQISGLIAVPIDGALCFAIAAWRDDGLSARCFDGLNQGVAVVGLVGNDRLGLEVLDQRLPLCNVSDLARSHDQADRIAQRIDTCVDLGCQPTTGSADGLVLMRTVFFRAPAAC